MSASPRQICCRAYPVCDRAAARLCAQSAHYGPQTAAWSAAASVGRRSELRRRIAVPQARGRMLRRSSRPPRNIDRPSSRLPRMSRTLCRRSSRRRDVAQSPGRSGKSRGGKHDIVQNQYAGGLDDLLSVLNAEQTLLNCANQSGESAGGAVFRHTALLQALGGGWWNRVDETPASCRKPRISLRRRQLRRRVRA